ncbi:hypothetical protein ONZ45_g3336 [Pleurotus djamor]|nr:hypothetical protein ONZ45_g3336 [Pleurotus djamor]
MGLITQADVEANNAIDLEILRYTRLIRALGTRRNTHIAINKLPNELLSRIFKTAADVARQETRNQDNITTLLLLKSVCSRWSHVALETPDLWSTISLHQRAWVAEAFQRSKQAPLTIIGPLANLCFDEKSEFLLSKLLSATPRIVKLDLMVTSFDHPHRPRDPLNLLQKYTRDPSPLLRTLNIAYEGPQHNFGGMPDDESIAEVYYGFGPTLIRTKYALLNTSHPQHQTIAYVRRRLRGAITGSKYNDMWRKHRKIAMWLLNTKAVDAFTDTIDYETHILASSLYSESRKGEVPVNPARFAGRFALNMMLTLALGTRTPSASDPLVAEAIRLGMEFMQLTGPWTNATDFIKILQFFPTTARSRAQKLHSDFLNVYGALIQRVKKSLEAGEELSDYLVKTMLLCQEEEKLTWEDMCFLFIAFTTGGTSGIIEWFLALMPSHPHIAAKAHEELDRVIGRDTWPTAADESKLPYCRAILKEVLRVHAPFWMGTPHCSDEDFVYNGYFIPKNTVMILNVYALHHDEERYPDPWSFNPDRYLGDDLSASESAKQGDPQNRDHWAFGAGRRLCPAIVIAERELFLSISRLLWSFNFDSVPGEPISLNEYEGLSGRTPMPFRVSLTPRHENVHEVLGEVDEANSVVL